MVLRPLCSPINRQKPRFSPHGRPLELQHNGKLIDDHGSASNDQGDSCLDCLFLIRLKHFGVVSKAETCAAQNHALNQYYCLVDHAEKNKMHLPEKQNHELCLVL